MKNIYNIILLAVFAFVMYGCDTIEGEYRENADEIISSVTVFEFTGIQCVNCPGAHEQLEALHDQFGHNLQVVGVHGNEFAGPINGWFLRTQEGQDLAELMEVSSLPKGSVNSLKAGDNVTTASSWSNAIAKYGYRSPDLILTAAHEVKDTIVQLTIEGEFVENMTNEYNNLYLCAYLLENNIIGPQDDINLGRIAEYEHKHVLRATFSGITGELLLSKAQAGMKIEKTKLALKLDENWNTENLEVVVFVYAQENMELIPFIVTYN